MGWQSLIIRFGECVGAKLFGGLRAKDGAGRRPTGVAAVDQLASSFVPLFSDWYNKTPLFTR